MNGKYLYLAITCLLGILSFVQSPSIFFTIFLLYLSALYFVKQFPLEKLTVFFIIYLIFFIVSFSIINQHGTRISEKQRLFHVKYDSELTIDGDQFQALVTEETKGEKLLVRYKIRSEEEKEALKKKANSPLLCKSLGELKKPYSAHNPNGFEYDRYLERKHIFWIIKLSSSPFENCTPLKPSPLSILKENRLKGIRYLESNFPADTAAVAAALIFGDRGSFDADLLAAYQKIGIIHLLAISGLHVSLSIGMLYYLGIRLGMTKEKMLRLLLVFLPVYAVLTGGSPSVIRSVLMIFIMVAADRWKHKHRLQPIDTLSLAFIGFLLFSPNTIFDAGFQLSFSVSFALILSAPYIITRYPNNLHRLLATSYISQLSALPFLLYHFFEISLIGILVNLVFIPLYSFVFLPGVYVLFFMQLIFGSVPSPIMIIFTKIIRTSNVFALSAAQYPFVNFVVGRPSIVMATVLILLCLFVFVFWEKSKKTKMATLILLLPLFFLMVQKEVKKLDPTGEVTAIDVGQGDSILIKLPRNHGTYLIDTGGTAVFGGAEDWRKASSSFEVGKNIVVPFLKGRGISKIDKLILTHGDTDHTGGSYSVIKELKIKEILMPSIAEPNINEKKIEALAAKKGIPVYRASDGDVWGDGKSFFRVLSPTRGFKGEPNTGSIVILAKLGGLNWLFTGDFDVEGERRLLQKYPALKIDVLKVGHHGSKTSTSPELLKKYKPQIAIISVGANNRFGHPNTETLKNLQNNGISILRTDLQGAITYHFFEEKGTFSTFFPYYITK